MPFTFKARIAQVGINPCVDVPARISRAIDVRGYVPVAGRLNAAEFRANLVPLGGMRHRLYLNSDMRTRAAVGVGDRVEITFEIDSRPRPVRLTPQLARALAADPAARAQWDALVPSQRKEVLAYLNSLKRVESIERNVAKVVAKLRRRGSGGSWR
jgi:hypothetical protein